MHKINLHINPSKATSCSTVSKRKRPELYLNIGKFENKQAKRMYNSKPRNYPDFKFPIQCHFLKFNGSWPTNYTPASSERPFFSYNNIIAMLYIVWSWLSIIATSVIVGAEFLFLLHHLDDVGLVAESCCAVFDGSLNVFRIVYMRLYTSELKEIMQAFIDGIWIPKNTHSRIQGWCIQKMIVFHVVAIFFSLLLLLYLAGPLWEYLNNGWGDEKPYPYPMVFPYDAQQDVAYTLTYLLAIFAGIVVLSTFFAVDTIFGFFVIYTCGQFEILHDCIDNIIPESYAYVLEHVEEECLRIWHFQRNCVLRLSRIVDMHCTLIRFSQRLEAFFSPMLLINFINSSVLICVVGFQIVTRSDLYLGDYIKFIIYGFAVFSQLVVLCWLGESLIAKSTYTVNHLYGCNWEGNMQVENKCLAPIKLKGRRVQGMLIYPTGREFAMNLKFMIMCSQQPRTITAYKFSILSLQSFTKIISTSLSYFALLQNLYDSAQN